ncbi:MAG: polyprenyl synthetase family protein [Planctomycetota bacterium]
MNMTGTTLSLSSLYAPIRADLSHVQRVFDDELAGDLAFINDLCGTVRTYRGKMLRPALLLLSARAAGEISSDHHTLAAVVELVHMATLVHDDVLDEADERRRQPSIRALAGNRAAVLLGDYLISHAFHLCSQIPCRRASQRIGATTNTVCEGEMLQTYSRGNAELPESTYLEIIRRKTGALTAVCCELGAFYASEDETVVNALKVFGESAGMAFQIMDDCLDITGDSTTLGKTAGRDFVMGTLTLPTIHFLRTNEESARRMMLNMFHGLDPVDPPWLRTQLIHSGAIDHAMSIASGHVSEARRQLDALQPSDAKSSLVAMADFMLARKF